MNKDTDDDAVIEAGRRLASERDDLIAAGVDPGALAVPLAGRGVDAGDDAACGFAGSSNEGYCLCTQPAGHMEPTRLHPFGTFHGCEHGGWPR